MNDLDPTAPGPNRSWTRILADQFDWQWRHLLRPRLHGVPDRYPPLSDDEYLWEPVPGAWSVRPRGTSTAPIQAGAGDHTIDFAFPEPVPPPVTTIAWRLGHVLVGVLAARNAAHFGAPAASYETWDYAADAATALEQLDTQVATWLSGVHALDDDGLARPVGETEMFPDAPMAELILHINRELIHHLAEVSLLRDLYAHRNGTLS